MKQQVLSLFNRELGSDKNNLEKCYDLNSKYLQQHKEIIESLSLTNTETPSKIAAAVQNAARLKQNTENITEAYDTLSKEICNHLENTEDVRRQASDYLNKISILEIALKYLNLLELINSLSSKLDHAYSNKDDEQCVTLYANLCEVSRNLQDSSASNLKSSLNDTVEHWHHILKEVFSKDFDEVLKTIKWPFVNTNFTLQPLSPQTTQKLQMLTEYLLCIQLPEEAPAPALTSALLSDFPRLSLPMMYLVKPLRKRFIYHFYGTRQTNRIDKPEWYFTQILSWIRDHHKFVVQWIQPVMDKLGLHHIDAKVELMCGLVQLAVEKLYSDLPTLQFDDFTFSHCVDEALGFDRELRETYDYPTNQASILAVLTQAQVFIKWLSMEKKYATEKIDNVLSSDEAFDSLASDVDEYKITICADMFITLLQTITDRYESLPQPGHRLQFLDLQLDLLDDFRIRLLQIQKYEDEDMIESRLPQIANTLNYIESVLIDWGTNVHYLHLYHYKNQFETIDSTKSSSSTDLDDNFGTVFDKVLFLYKRFKKELLSKIGDSVLNDVKARSRPYINDRWSTMSVQKDIRTLSLSTSACPMFEILATRLHQLQKSLAFQLFKTVWHSLAEHLDAFLFEELILQNRYNEGGALQLKFDVTRNLFPLFAQYTERPETYFNRLNESCILLNLSKGSALLLRETILAIHTLKDDGNTKDQACATLEEQGVMTISPKEAVKIFNLRSDIISLNDIILSM